MKIRILCLSLFLLILAALPSFAEVVTLLNAVTSTGAGTPASIEHWDKKGFQISIDAGTATVAIEISIDGSFIPITSQTTDAYVTLDGPAVSAQGNVTACTGCTVTLTVIKEGPLAHR